jgi:hypothetical protein
LDPDAETFEVVLRHTVDPIEGHAVPVIKRELKIYFISFPSKLKLTGSNCGIFCVESANVAKYTKLRWSA